VNGVLKRYCGGSSHGEAVDVSVKSVLKTVLHIIQHLRREKRPKWNTTGGDTCWKNNFWMDLNYLYVAQAARSCDAHFSAVMYTEIWLDRLNSTEHSTTGMGFSRLIYSL